MRHLSLGVRAYLWSIALACFALVAGDCVYLAAGTGTPLWHSPTLALEAVVFIALAYVGERTALRINEFVDQTFATPVHIAIILLFPVPLPIVIALISVTISQLVHVSLPLYKRLFNICHVALAVGLSSMLFSFIATPGSLLRPGHVTASVPALVVLIGLYYLFDVGIMIGLLTLLERRAPWRIWQRTYSRTVAPELATGAMGILAAVAWRFDPVLIILLILPMAALRTTFRAIAQAEDRAIALRRRSDGLEAVLASGQQIRLPQTQTETLRPVAAAARTVAGAAVVTAYLPDEDDPATLRRVVVVPAMAAAGVGPSWMPLPAFQDDIHEDEGALVVPLKLESVGVLGLLWLSSVSVEHSKENRDALAILATQSAIALQNARLYREAQEGVAAREADRLKGELLNTVSHELRTPLGAIKGFASGLLTYGAQMSEAERLDALHMIDEGANRLSELVDNLLSVQGLESGGLVIRHEPVDIAAIVRDVVAETAPGAPEHTLTARTPAVVPVVIGDERRLRQVLSNLIGNAVKYSPGGGRIDVSVTGRRGQIEMRVADEGIGIPPEQLERVFERFHRVDNTNTRRIYGTGLGLTIVMRLVEAHGGRVWAESAGPGQGSVFVVTLPPAEGAAEHDDLPGAEDDANANASVSADAGDGDGDEGSRMTSAQMSLRPSHTLQ